MADDRPVTIAYLPETGEALIGDHVVLHNVHPPGRCAGETCVIHHPSAHHMRSWAIAWDDRRLFVRYCRHGVAHPDPDQREFFEQAAGPGGVMHLCDGCCAPDPRDQA